MKKNARAIVITLLLVGSLTVDPLNQTALANSDIESKLSNIEKEREENKKEAGEKQKELEQLEREKKEIINEIERLDHEYAETNQKIREKRAEINQVRENIEKLQAEIIIIEERITERDKLLKDRARSMYQSGGSINYLEVVLGAKSFGDFLDRLSALAVIAQQDRNILDAHIEDHLELEKAKEKVEKELQTLEGHLIELENLMEKLEKQRDEKEKIMKLVEKQEDELHTDLGELEGADEILRAQEQALKNELAAHEERLRREAEEEQKRQNAEAAATTSRSNSGSANNSNSNNSNGSTSQVHSSPSVTSSGFMRPATGSITSTYGPRAVFGGQMHYGIDIGKNGRTGDVPIVAVQEGTVVQSYYSSSYGNVVLIAHQVDGRLITTLYAHMENREVSSGQRVSKGQRIGLMGNTGQSFGAHLHFEVHEGGWNAAKSNAVDPFRYIPR